MKRLAAVVLVVGLTIAVQASAPWSTFTSPEGRFTVKFPLAPEATSMCSPSPLGQITTYLFTSKYQQGSYTVTYSDLPRAAVVFAKGRIFDDTRAEILRDAGAQTSTWNDVGKFGEGREMRYQGSEDEGLCHIHLVRNRLYVIDARCKTGTPQTETDVFFSSLKI